MPFSRPAPLRVPHRALIGGTWTGEGPETFAVRDPATGRELAALPDLGPEVADAVMEGAQAGFVDWRRWPARRRADVLWRTVELLVERTTELAEIITLEMGKPVAESRTEVEYAVGFVRYYAERSTQIEGRHARHERTGDRILTQRDPVGPCLLVTPWNFPLGMVARKVAPALAAGCSVVMKPSEETPLSALAFAGILLEAGLPDRAVSVVTSTRSAEVTGALIDHPLTAKLSFTGSTGVGRELAGRGGRALLRTSLELGGDAPFLVFADADVAAAVDGAQVAKFRNGGQACVAANRFLVHEQVVDEFVAGLTDVVRRLRPGHGLDPDSTIGPVIADRAAERLHAAVEDAVGRGAHAVHGPRVADARGTNDRLAAHRFVPGTILTEVPDGAAITGTEIFGPVAVVSVFRDEDDALARANATPYGLVAYAYTQDVRRLLRLSRQIEAGMVGINTGLVSNPAAPFGGIGHSGFGREGGPEGLDEYLQTRYVALPDGLG